MSEIMPASCTGDYTEYTAVRLIVRCPFVGSLTDSDAP